MALLDSPATGLVSGSKAVTTAGTAVQISATATGIRWLLLTADPANTKPVYVGDSGVDATLGSEIGVPLSKTAPLRLDVSDLSDVWIDAEASGEGVLFVYGVV